MHISRPSAAKGGVRDALKRASLHKTGRSYLHIGNRNLHISSLICIFETIICIFEASFAYLMHHLHIGEPYLRVGNLNLHIENFICIVKVSFAHMGGLICI